MHGTEILKRRLTNMDIFVFHINHICRAKKHTSIISTRCIQYTTSNIFIIIFKLHHKNGTSYFFIFYILFVGKIILFYSVKFLELEDTLLTHLIAYSIQNYINKCAFGKATIERCCMNYSKHDAFLSFQDNILCFCFTKKELAQQQVCKKM